MKADCDAPLSDICAGAMFVHSSDTDNVCMIVWISSLVRDRQAHDRTQPRSLKPIMVQGPVVQGLVPVLSLVPGYRPHYLYLPSHWVRRSPTGIGFTCTGTQTGTQL